MDRSAAMTRTTKYGTTMMTLMITTSKSVVTSDMLGMMGRSAAGTSNIRGGITMTGTRITSISVLIRIIGGMICISAAMITIIIGGIIRIEGKGASSRKTLLGKEVFRNSLKRYAESLLK